MKAQQRDAGSIKRRWIAGGRRRGDGIESKSVIGGELWIKIGSVMH